MREILFRGKDAKSGRWHEGSLVYLDAEHVYIVPPCERATTLPISAIIAYTAVYIDSETVCQFTGVIDRNGKKIFDGDVVRHYNNKEEPESYDFGIVRWDREYASFERTAFPGPVRFHETCDYEVVGNIFDNPEYTRKGDSHE